MSPRPSGPSRPTWAAVGRTVAATGQPTKLLLLPFINGIVVCYGPDGPARRTRTGLSRGGRHTRRYDACTTFVVPPGSSGKEPCHGQDSRRVIRPPRRRRGGGPGS